LERKKKEKKKEKFQGKSGRIRELYLDSEIRKLKSKRECRELTR
jgi:hypothetical protein